MRSKYFFLPGLAAVLVSGTGLAQSVAPSEVNNRTNPPGMAANYARMDRDKDNSLSKREAAPNKELVQQWVNLDVNQDGKLDEAEFAQFETEPISRDRPAKY